MGFTVMGLRHSASNTQRRRADCADCMLQGIIRRVQEDGPNRGNVDLDILPRSVRYRLKDVIDEARACHAGAQHPALIYLKSAISGSACRLQPLGGLAGHIMLSVQGRINKIDIDARMLKALADLPVDLGIEAIDKFAMASLDSIRSKTGFMVRACRSCYTGPASKTASEKMTIASEAPCTSADGNHQANPGRPVWALP